MKSGMPQKTPPPRIESFHIRNYRVLHNVEFNDISPLTVLLGPNGSGKSTVFDAFAFLSECFAQGLRKAWDRRGRFKELRSRGVDGAIEFEVKFREYKEAYLTTYHLTIEETPSGPVVSDEWLRWKRKPQSQPFYFLRFQRGFGEVISGDMPEEDDERVEEKLDSPEMLAVNTLGQFAKHPRVSALRRFITGWYLSYLTADHTRGAPDAGPQEHLTQTGDNLPNVIQYLAEQHPETLNKIIGVLTQRIPQLEKVNAELLADGRLLLQVKDAPFERPVLAKWASDGTLKMLAYLTVLHNPATFPLIGIEEPENHLHPRLLPELAEECRSASVQSQLLVSTHSPFFVNEIRPRELWVLYRESDGFTRVRRASDMKGIEAFIEEGAKLGQLWTEGQFDVGDPLGGSQAPITARKPVKRR